MESARLGRDDVVQVRLRDGGQVLLDARGMAASGAGLARALDHYALAGGPGSETRDAMAVSVRLGCPSTTR